MNNSCASTRELFWGISLIANVQPQKRRFTSFASIKDNLYISSDGMNSYIWDINGVKQTIKLPAIALHYIKEIDHIIASVNTSTHLHFLSLQEPTSVVVHPLSFSIKIISSLYYLPKSGTLVTTGQGITFSKMTIPEPTGNCPFSQLIEFTRLAELYKDENFSRYTSPISIESEDSVVVPIDRSIYVHSSDGTLIGSVDNIIPSRISSLSFYEGKRFIIIGDELGNVYFTEYGQYSSPVASKISNNSHILMASLFDRYLLITVEQNKTLSLINVDTESRIEKVEIDSEIVEARPEGNRILVFSSKNDVLVYDVSIFTKFLTHLTADALKIERRLEPAKPSTIFCYQKDSIVSSFLSKSGRKLLELVSISPSNKIADFIFDDDSLFLRFISGNIVKVDIVHQSDIFAISNDSDDKDFQLRKTVLKVPQLSSKIVQIIKYSKSDGEKCILAISEQGHIFAFSIEKGIVIDTSYVGCQDLISCVFINFFNSFVLSSKSQLIVVDSESLKVVKKIERSFVTCFLFVESKSTLFVGDAQGCIESFDLPSFSSKCSSTRTHSSNGERRPLSEYISLSEVPFSVKYLEYLKSRELIISVSNEGEIFLWNSEDLFPFAHLNFSFGISAGCFYDSNGSVLISSFECLFVVPYTDFFDNQVDEKMIEMLDEFNKIDLEVEKPFKSIKIDPNVELIDISCQTEGEVISEVQKGKNFKNVKKFDVDEKIDQKNDIEKSDSSLNSKDDEINDNPLGNSDKDVTVVDDKERKESEFNDIIAEIDSVSKNNSQESDLQQKEQVLSTKIIEKYEKFPSPPSERPPKAAPRGSKGIKQEKSAKKTTLFEKKEDIRPKPPSEKPLEENVQIRKKMPLRTYKNFFARNQPNNDSIASKDQNENLEREKEEIPPFSVDVHKRSSADDSFMHYHQPSPTFVSDDNDIDDLGNSRNARNGITQNDPNNNSSIIRSQSFEFIEPNYDYGKIGTVTMEEFEDYMKRNAVIIKKPMTNQRRTKSMRNAQNQRIQKINNNNKNSRQQFLFPRIARVQRK